MFKSTREDIFMGMKKNEKKEASLDEAYNNNLPKSTKHKNISLGNYVSVCR